VTAAGFWLLVICHWSFASGFCPSTTLRVTAAGCLLLVIFAFAFASAFFNFSFIIFHF
jgi:hypothetical protein